MNPHLRAVGVDYDGTLTCGGQPSAEVLAAVSEARQAGLRIVLVTGRILEELRATFPSVDEHFDAIVGENGAVMSMGGSDVLLSVPVERELDAALERRSVSFRRGQVLLATTIEFQGQIQDEIHRLGLECQLVHNRSELMVLPPGVSKGNGLGQALAALGTSLHSAAGLGDAENDHSLLNMSEVGVAVANAVDGLKRHADLVLDEPNGEGVAGFLRDLAGDRAAFRPLRRHIGLGDAPGGRPVTVPTSQVNLLVTGRSQSGKSYAAGIVAEQLIDQQYSVCLIDPEGDYTSLSFRHGVECLCSDAMPDHEQLFRLLRNGLNSVIVDLSLSERTRHSAYIDTLLRKLAGHYRSSGLPHWLIIDEAHNALGFPGALDAMLRDGRKGICLVTYQPQALGESVFGMMDYVLAVSGGRQTRGPDPLRQVEQLCSLPDGLPAAQGDEDAWLIDINDHCRVHTLKLAQRQTAHVRHRHKYQQGKLPQELRFIFRGRDGLGSASAANALEFRKLVRTSPADTIAFHAERMDFSRWIGEALQDLELASRVRIIENRYLASRRSAEDLATLSRCVADAVAKHYG